MILSLCVVILYQFCWIHLSKKFNTCLQKLYYSLQKSPINPILNSLFRDVSENLLELLMKEYKYIRDKAEKDKRLRITMYFCEATKFKLIPQNHVLDCLQDCLNSPSGFNIDVMIKILEKVGYYLIHTPDKNDKLRFEMQLT